MAERGDAAFVFDHQIVPAHRGEARPKLDKLLGGQFIILVFVRLPAHGGRLAYSPFVRHCKMRCELIPVPGHGESEHARSVQSPVFADPIMRTKRDLTIYVEI